MVDGTVLSSGTHGWKQQGGGLQCEANKLNASPKGASQNGDPIAKSYVEVTFESL